MKKSSSVLWKLYGFVFGVVFGLFFGVFVVGTAINVLLHLLFHYGDSGPMWVNVLLTLGTLASVVVCTRISMSWVRTRLTKDTSPVLPSGDSAGAKNG